MSDVLRVGSRVGNALILTTQNIIPYFQNKHISVSSLTASGRIIGTTVGLNYNDSGLETKSDGSYYPSVSFHSQGNYASFIRSTREGFFELLKLNGTLGGFHAADSTFRLESRSIGSSQDLVQFHGNFHDGRFATRFRKEDTGGGVGFYIDESRGTIGSYHNLLRLGQVGDDDYLGVLYGNLRVSGRETMFGGNDWDSTNVTKLKFQNHEMFWVGAGNSTWYTGAANHPSQETGHIGSRHSHDLLLTTKFSTNDYYRGITFAAMTDSSSHYRLGRWHSGGDRSTSQMVVDGQFFAKGGSTVETDAYENSPTERNAGNAGWDGDNGSQWGKPSIIATGHMQIQSGNANGQATRNPTLTFHQYGYGGPALRFDGPARTLYIEQERSGTDRLRHIVIKTNSGTLDLGPQNTSWCHIHTDRPGFHFDKKLSLATGTLESHGGDLLLRRNSVGDSWLMVKDSETVSNQKFKVHSDDGLFISTKTNGAGASLTLSDQAVTTPTQYGSIKYFHSDGAIVNNMATSNDGFVFSGTESDTIFRFEGHSQFAGQMYVESTFTTIGGAVVANGTNLLLRAGPDSNDTGDIVFLADNGSSELGRLHQSGSIPYWKENGGTSYRIHHQGNDGSGSGLDADLWDGRQFSDYLNQNVRSGDSPKFNSLFLDKSSGISVDAVKSTGSASTLWNVFSSGPSQLLLNNSNNAMSFILDGTTNGRKAMIQVGHSSTSYAENFGTLYLNKLGGGVGLSTRTHANENGLFIGNQLSLGTSNLSIWHQVVTASATLHPELRTAEGGALSEQCTYKVRLQTTGTGTITGSSFLLWYNGEWRFKTLSGDSQSSNHPTLRIVDGTPRAVTSHPSNYSIDVMVERYQNHGSNGNPVALSYMGPENWLNILGGKLRFNPYYSTTDTVLNQGHLIYHQGNDGSGSGLDADLWDGHQFDTYLNQNVRTDAAVKFSYITVNQTSGTDGAGISLYGNHTSGTPTYGMLFADIGTLGSHGSVTGSWATYFTMSSDSGRGWIFRDQSTGTNIASISNRGKITSDGVESISTIRAKGTGNAYDAVGFESRGNGTANSVKPGYGFHQPGLYAGSIKMLDRYNFHFLQQDNSSYTNIHVAEVHADNTLVFNGMEPTSTTVSGLGSSSGYIRFPHRSVGTTSSYVPYISGAVQYSGGYLTHGVLGIYKSTSGWGNNSTGWFFALGGNDNHPTEAFKMTYGGNMYNPSGNMFYHQGNDGSGSGLDADLLDGINSSSFLRSDVSDTMGGHLYSTGGVHVNTNSGSTPFIISRGASSSSQVCTVVVEDAYTVFKHIGDEAGEGRFAFKGDPSDAGSTDLLVFDMSEIFYKGNTIWHAGNDGVDSGLDADLLDGYNAYELSGRQSESNFPDGTLVTTDLSYSTGASFVVEITGKGYSGGNPFSVIAEGYLYSNQIYNAKVVDIVGSFNVNITMFIDTNGDLALWWPYMAYWQSFKVSVRNASNSRPMPRNYVTNITNSGDPSGSATIKKVVETQPIRINNSISAIDYKNVSNYWLRTSTNWGLYWNTTDDRLEYHGSGETKAYVNLGSGHAWFAGDLTLGATGSSGNRVLRVLSSDSYASGIEAYGASQGTGYLYVGQSVHHGGGVSYNGDGTPSYVSGEIEDEVCYYRRNGGTNTAVFGYKYDSSEVMFRVTPKVATNSMWHSGNDGSGSGLDADLLDGLQASQFLRSDNDDHFIGKLAVGSTAYRSAGMYGTYDSAKIGHIWSMGTAYTIPNNGANFGNLYGFAYKHTNNATGGTMAGGHQAVWCIDGSPKAALGDNGLWGVSLDITGTSKFGLTPRVGSSLVYHQGNDGSGSGLDADLWDGHQFSSYLNQGVRSTDSPTFSTVTLNGNLGLTGDAVIKLGPGSSGSDYGIIHWTGTSNAGQLRIATADDVGSEPIVFGDYDTSSVSSTFTEWGRINRNATTFNNHVYVSAFTETSDARIKSEIETVSNQRDFYRNVRGKHYLKQGVADSGVIAQELEAFDSRYVSEQDDTTGKSGLSDLKSVSYSSLHAFHIEAHRDHYDYEQTSKEEILTLKKRIAELESKLTKVLESVK